MMAVFDRGTQSPTSYQTGEDDSTETQALNHIRFLNVTGSNRKLTSVTPRLKVLCGYHEMHV